MRHDSDSAIRIADASLNRAREALRVLDDVARFHLDDEQLCREIKELRHAIVAAGGVFGERAMLLSRDTPGDVGTGVTTDAEGARGDLHAIAAAACGRLTESLRSLEECAKLVATDGGAFKRARYAAYDVEKRVLLALSPPRARQWALCVLLTESLCPGGDWRGVALAAMRGGADCLQLREKTLDGRGLVERVRWLVGAAREHGANVVVNDRADVALAGGAAGVHLGQSDLGVRDVRAIAGDRLIVGVSCATLEHAIAAVRDGADMVGLGPMFPSTTKPKDASAVARAGTGLLRAVLDHPGTRGLPHLCISGIDAARAGELARLGCRGVAVSAAVCSAADPEAAARAIRDALAPLHSGHGSHVP
ncbi:MAG: thiamine phosphate synthase [Phycisphaerales bacterium]|jgi:thiamine-phosphate pyrophosphorylase|nr:thiamine phosphate synthase [Phycisphaerales bacterium]